MNLVAIFISSLFILCGCSKRNRPGWDTGDEPELKRIKTVLASLSESVLRGDVEGFSQILGLDNGTAGTYLEEEHISDLLQTALDNGHAKLLQRMMTLRSFQDALNYGHLNLALCSCLPDVLKIFLSAWQVPESLTEEDGDEIRRLQQTSLSTCPAKIKLLASAFQPLWETIVQASKRYPDTLEYLLKEHCADDLEDVSPIDFELLWLAGLHLPHSSMSTFFYEWIWIDDREGAHGFRPTIFLVMENILKAIDTETPETLFKILEDVDSDETCTIKVNIMTIEAIVKRKRYDLLQNLVINGPKASFISYKRFTNMLCGALRDGKVDLVNSVLGKLSPPLCIASMRHFLQDQFDDWVLEGDLQSIHSASEYLFPFLNIPQKRYVNLVLRVFVGDWRYLIVFMQMNPNRIMISDAAWEVLLCLRPSDIFINMILNSQV